MYRKMNSKDLEIVILKNRILDLEEWIKGLILGEGGTEENYPEIVRKDHKLTKISKDAELGGSTARR